MRSSAHAARVGFAATLLLLGITMRGGPIWAMDLSIVAVEEDWELVVTSPDAATDAPQVTCIISPQGNLLSVHAALEINQQTIPAYAAGGMQLQAWCGELPLAECKLPSMEVLSTDNETVSWTQKMRLADSTLVFEVTNGESQTWGQFGGGGSLRLSLATTLANLNQYDPQVSIANSRIGYATNRVQSLVLKRLRVYLSNGEVVEDDTPRVVYRQSS